MWSYGVVVWELATGLEPWAEQSPMQVIGAVGWGGATLDFPPGVEPGLRAIIQSCWAAEPQLRPSFGDLITSIRVRTPCPRCLNLISHGAGSTNGHHIWVRCIPSSCRVQSRYTRKSVLRGSCDGWFRSACSSESTA